MAKKQKRIEVLSPIITSTNEPVAFTDILAHANSKAETHETKSIEIRTMTTEHEGCTMGIMITCQNKDLPPKRNNRTGEFSAIGINVNNESLSYGNILLYDSQLNVLLYEVNLNGCDPDLFGGYLVNCWNHDHEENCISLKFSTVVRKSEYERAMRMGFYKEFYAELTCPTEIAQAYRDETALIYKLAKSYVDNAVKSNSDTIVVKMSSFGKMGKDNGLNVRYVKKMIESFHYLQLGIQNKNVTQLRVKGYFTDPDEPNTIQPVNLVADTFREYIKLEVKQFHTNLQEAERKSEIEKVYKKIKPELRRILTVER